MEEFQNQDTQQDNPVQPMQKPKIQISSWLGFVIIGLVAILLFSGAFGLQYFLTKNAKLENQDENANLQNETVGWQTYRNDEYGFEFKYPENIVVYKLFSNYPKEIISLERENSKRNSACSLYDYYAVLEGDVDFSKNFSREKLLENKEYKKVAIDNMEIFKSYIEEGWLTKSFLVFIFSEDGKGFYFGCNANIKSHIEDEALDADINLDIFSQIISTFKFTNPPETADWKTYTNEKYGYKILYPSDGSYLLVPKDGVSEGADGYLVDFQAENLNVRITTGKNARNDKTMDELKEARDFNDIPNVSMVNIPDSAEKISVDGSVAYKWSGFDKNYPDEKTGATTVIFNGGDYFYIVQSSCFTQEVGGHCLPVFTEEREQVYDLLLSTFKFIK